jgi:hypothetical protein
LGDRAHLEATELPPFRAAIQSGVDAVLVAHVTVPALEPDANRVATISSAVIAKTLKQELGFSSIASDDAPDKLLDFYRKELRRYGEISECRGSVSFVHGTMRCKGTGDETNLVTGTDERHHIVSVKPDDGGSKFALVYVQTRRGEGTL